MVFGTVLPVRFRERGSLPPPARVDQFLERVPIGIFHQIQLVVDLKWVDAGCQPVTAWGHLDEIRSYGRVGDELASEGVSPIWEATRGFDPSWSPELKCGICAV